MKNLIMCPPLHFDVVYELSTNQWMDKNRKPDKALANQQWTKLYEECCKSAKVTLMPSCPGLPDLIFVANAGLRYRDAFIFSHFFHEERRKEFLHHFDFFGKLLKGHTTYVLPENCYFEGQGDAVWLDDKRLVIGYGIRTNFSGVKAVETLLKKHYPEIEVYPIAMRPQSTFYHLDTCLCYLPKAKAFLAYPEALLREGMETLSQLGKICPVIRQEADEFVCNSVVINEETIFMPWASQSIKNLMKEFGYPNVQTFPMSEFLKSGGAVKCLILEM